MSESSTGRPEVRPHPAATVVLIRPSQADLEVLMLLRNAKLAFNPGHWVFPGGKIDRCDFEFCGGDLEYPAALRAAVRETEEEAGICIAPEDLIHTAHWTTPDYLPRRYSTWFFLCPCPEPVEVRIDNGEIKDYRWVSPLKALEAIESGELKVPRPTQTTLQDISAFRSLQELLTGIEGRKIRVFPENSPFYRPEEMGYRPA